MRSAKKKRPFAVGIQGTGPEKPAHRGPTTDSLGLAHSVSTPTSPRIDEPTREIFDKAFRSLRQLASGCDVFIAHSPSMASIFVEWSSGPFAKLQGRALSVSRGPWALALSGSDPISVHEVEEFKTESDLFTDFPQGHIVLLPVRLAGDAMALLGLFQPSEQGPPSSARLTALREWTELLELATSASDLAQDVQAQQLRLDLMRDEMTEVQQFYRQFSETISQCFWVLDLKLQRVLVVSDNFERVWGGSRRCLSDGLTGFMAHVYPEDRDTVLSKFHLALGSDLNAELGAELDVEFRVVDELGELRWIWLRGFPIHEDSATETVERIVLIADDVTEKKQDEERLREQEAKLASRANLIAVGELASGVAHEINNPLTVIVGKSSELRRWAEKGRLEPEKVLETTEKIRATSVRISEIVSSLKALARQDRSQNNQRVALQKIFAELKHMCSERFKSFGVGLEIPEFPEDFAAEMNPTMISQMLMNLLNNALDAVQSEKQKWVKVDFAEDEESIYLYVTDSGPGIPIRNRSRIFDPFFTTKDPGKGTGLGLSLSANIAAHHNGSLRYDHLHPHTRFVIQLPKRQPQKGS